MYIIYIYIYTHIHAYTYKHISVCVNRQQVIYIDTAATGPCPFWAGGATVDPIFLPIAQGLQSAVVTGVEEAETALGSRRLLMLAARRVSEHVTSGSQVQDQATTNV